MARVCIHPGCTVITTGSRCPQHQAVERKRLEARRGSRPWYDAEWQRRSRQARADQPYCSRCGSREDLTTDHVQPRSLALGVVVLCRRCNSSKRDRRAG